MSTRILSTGSAAAVLAAFAFFAGQDAAQAARCPLGQIYRPSHGFCQSKEKAIQAGVYHGSRHVAQHAVARKEASTAPKARAQALAEIEKFAPRAGREEEALAYATDRKPVSAAEPVRAAEPAPTLAVATPIEPKRVKVVPIVFTRPQPSPFGSLVALEPMP